MPNQLEDFFQVMCKCTPATVPPTSYFLFIHKERQTNRPLKTFYLHAHIGVKVKRRDGGDLEPAPPSKLCGLVTGQSEACLRRKLGRHQLE